jgi:hypothetical protein
VRDLINALSANSTSDAEITSGELLRVEVDGELKVTRMEVKYRHLPGGDGAYYSIDGYLLCDGLCAAIGAHE